MPSTAWPSRRIDWECSGSLSILSGEPCVWLRRMRISSVIWESSTIKTGSSMTPLHPSTAHSRSIRTTLNALLYLGKTSEALGDMPKALSLYKKLEEKHLDDPEVFYHLAMAYGKVNQPGDSHYYFGLYFKKKEKADSALFHFKAALKLFPPDAVRSREIAKEIESLKTPSGGAPSSTNPEESVSMIRQRTTTLRPFFSRTSRRVENSSGE